ncbi:MAG TPA: alpha/beta fold hydrolase [Dermatophilaceae bacterium]|nr:alpha/beta fold hydrolase [Dermatophilaceae bacterium]
MPIMPGAEPFTADGGPVAVLISHGFTGTPQGVRPLARALAEAGLTVRLPRLPGHGTNWQELNRTRWQDWYSVLDRELTQLHRTCAHVVVAGLSMGGTLVTRLAQEHGPRVTGLVLINPVFRVDDPRMRALPALQYLVGSLPGITNDIKKTDGDPELGYDRIPLRALHSQTQLWRTVIQDLPEVTQPVLLIRSQEDHVVPASSAALFLSRVGSTEVTELVLTDSYHVATLDNDAPRIVEETLRFVGRVTGWPGP